MWIETQGRVAASLLIALGIDVDRAVALCAVDGPDQPWMVVSYVSCRAVLAELGARCKHSRLGTAAGATHAVRSRWRARRYDAVKRHHQKLTPGDMKNRPPFCR